MNNFISLNIKYLCEENNLSQNEFGQLFHLKKGVIGTYIREKTNPQVQTMQKICEYFKISLDDFVNKELNRLQPAVPQGPAPLLYNTTETIEVLKEHLSDKEKLIKLLEEDNLRLRSNEKREGVA